MNTKTLYSVKIGYGSTLDFASKEDAIKVFDLLSTTPLINVSTVMADKFNEDKKDYSNYEYLSYLSDEKAPITLEAREVSLMTLVDAKKIKDERKKAREELEAKKGKSQN